LIHFKFRQDMISHHCNQSPLKFFNTFEDNFEIFKCDVHNFPKFLNGFLYLQSQIYDLGFFFFKEFLVIEFEFQVMHFDYKVVTIQSIYLYF